MTKAELEEEARDLRERSKELRAQMAESSRVEAGLRDEVAAKDEQIQRLIGQSQELNTKVLWLEHRLAQFKRAHTAMIDGFLS